jgi:predicted enzyme related to lactoylglutathione lyase
MALIKHIALIAEDPRKVAEFYANVFDMTITGVGDGGDLWMTDGYMEFALFPLNGTNPKGIHHFGLALAEDEKAAIYDKLAKRDRLPFDPATDLPATDRSFGDDAILDADGNRVDLAIGASAAASDNTPKIKHIALFTEQPEELAEFYCDVFGMTLTGVTGRGAHWVSDGYVNFALLFKRSEKQPKGINHFGFVIDEAAKPAIHEKLSDLGIKIFQPAINNDRPFVEDGALDIEGNRFDISTAVREIDTEMARPREEKELEPADGV